MKNHSWITDEELNALKELFKKAEFRFYNISVCEKYYITGFAFPRESDGQAQNDCATLAHLFDMLQDRLQHNETAKQHIKKLGSLYRI